MIIVQILYFACIIITSYCFCVLYPSLRHFVLLRVWMMKESMRSIKTWRCWFYIDSICSVSSKMGDSLNGSNGGHALPVSCRPCRKTTHSYAATIITYTSLRQNSHSQRVNVNTEHNHALNFNGRQHTACWTDPQLENGYRADKKSKMNDLHVFITINTLFL